MFIALGNRGSKIILKKHPRKELLEHFGRKHADKVYRGEGEHIGYIVAGELFTIKRMEPWKPLPPTPGAAPVQKELFSNSKQAVA